MLGNILFCVWTASILFHMTWITMGAKVNKRMYEFMDDSLKKYNGEDFDDPHIKATERAVGLDGARLITFEADDEAFPKRTMLALKFLRKTRWWPGICEIIMFTLYMGGDSAWYWKAFCFGVILLMHMRWRFLYRHFSKRKDDDDHNDTKPKRRRKLRPKRRVVRDGGKLKIAPNPA